MKPEDQRIAIAEATGRYERDDNGSGVHWHDRQCGMDVLLELELPDYLHDVNAMHSAKVALLNTPALQDTYACILGALTGGKRIDYGASKVDVTTKILFAEANQEAEALLRAIGKWVD